jgi:dihydroorotate dehydrogenase
MQIIFRKFGNPVGIAAGFDKQAKAVLGLQDLGFGFIEVGVEGGLQVT